MISVIKILLFFSKFVKKKIKNKKPIYRLIERYINQRENDAIVYLEDNQIYIDEKEEEKILDYIELKSIYNRKDYRNFELAVSDVIDDLRNIIIEDKDEDYIERTKNIVYDYLNDIKFSDANELNNDFIKTVIYKIKNENIIISEEYLYEIIYNFQLEKCLNKYLENNNVSVNFTYSREFELSKKDKNNITENLSININIKGQKEKIDDLFKATDFYQELNDRFYSYLRRFVKREANPNLFEIANIAIREQDVKALQDILSNDYNINIEYIELKNELNREITNYFGELFEELSKVDEVNTIEDFVNSYISVFESNVNITFIEHLDNFYKKDVNSLNNYFKEELYEKIKNKINNIAYEHRKKLIKDDINNDSSNNQALTKISIKDIDIMDGYIFEDFLVELFNNLGYESIATPKTGDQGADLIIKKNGIKTIVQAKRYSSTVSNKAIQEAIAAKQYYNADDSLVVTNNYFTKSAKDLAQKSNVRLWNRDKLKEHMSSYNFDMIVYF